MKTAKILYFIDGPAPTSEQIMEAASVPAKVVFRNARAVSPDSSLELCDGVMGAVPKTYAKAYPDARTAVEANFAKLQAASKGKFKDTAPPKPDAAQPAQTPVVTPTEPEPNQAPAQAPTAPAQAAPVQTTQPTGKQPWGSQPTAKK